jgi:hypothetical protein
LRFFFATLCLGAVLSALRNISSRLFSASESVMSKKNTPKPYDRLPNEDRGDDSPSPVYTAVGAALSAWELLQEELAYLFAKLVKTDENNVALHRAFGTMDNALPKVKMMMAAADAHLAGKDELLREVKAVLNNIQNFNHRRNDIAHGFVFPKRVPEDRGFCLTHGMTSTARFDLELMDTNPFAYEWTSKQVDYYRDEFKKLRDAIVALTATVP